MLGLVLPSGGFCRGTVRPKDRRTICGRRNRNLHGVHTPADPEEPARVIKAQRTRPDPFEQCDGPTLHWGSTGARASILRVGSDSGDSDHVFV